ncbi:type I polyketide synthase, partial [Anaeromyxobacter oryzisoli]|uniref:type I polyketide synthase n=1 Tax=Anaeromyxobacter oryzisoli TaxID=2925408 RepID=UPI001F59137E
MQILRRRADQHGDRRAYTYLRDGEEEQGTLTYAALDRRARAVASEIQRLGASGHRALLLFPQGLEVIEAFFGALYGGAVAVPIPPPDGVRGGRTTSRLMSVAADAQPRIVIGTRATLAALEGDDAWSDAVRGVPRLAVEDVSDSCAFGWTEPSIDPNGLAYLQYTSGSTSTPKGTMLLHRNVVHNCSAMHRLFHIDADGVGATWMPYFHDFGLVEGLLLPMYSGVPAVVMSPVAFIKNPLRWLRAISRYHVTQSSSPVFGYDYCVRRFRPEQCEGLDLGSWRVANMGAEPIRADVMERFRATFAPYGFRGGTLSPGYGLAETTLAVAGTMPGTEARAYTFDADALRNGKVREVSPGAPRSRPLVGCGAAVVDTEIAIVEPSSGRRCGPDEVGEIWVSSPSVAAGYWQRPEASASTFDARLAGEPERAYLRTGDLGFLRGGALFIAGRVKDLIILDGANHYPEDIEATLRTAHEAIADAGSIAFSVDSASGERLVIVQELRSPNRYKDRVDEIIGSIRRAVFARHDLAVAAVALIKPGSLPKTSSGKVQRQACRQMFLDGALDAIRVWSADTAAAAATATPREDTTPPLGQAELERWLVERVAHLVSIPPERIDVRAPFASYGMGSRAAVGLVGEIEQRVGHRLRATLAYEYPSIEALARHLAGPDDAPRAPACARGDRADEPVAIVGIGCRFPGGGDSPEAFWRVLVEGIDAIGEIPRDRWPIERFYDPDPQRPGHTHVRHGGFLRDVDRFDCDFFGISPREAQRMDPQQRLLLEVAWEALEDAGVVPSRLAGERVGVYVGISGSEYEHLQLRDLDGIDAYFATGNALSVAANRISYQLDLRGPSMAIDGACASSLLSVHLACEGLRHGQTSMALAGGVGLLLSPAYHINFSKAGLLAADGRCKTFDARADGYVRSEGAGLVLLKPLSAALAAGDRIYAVLRGSAAAHNGRSNGLMAPSREAQEALLREAYARAGVSPGDVDYVEAHGTGTLLGDPIEAAALGAVIATGRRADRPCAIGSVKTNVGHLEAAAGIAGLVKTALALYHRELPPSLHFERPNPHIDFEALRLSVQTKLAPWGTAGRPRLAGVSSLGFGGSSVHAVLEEAPAREAPAQDAPARPAPLALPVLLSAKTEAALRAEADRLHMHLVAHPDIRVEDLAFSLATCRTSFRERAALVAHGRDDLLDALASLVHGSPVPDAVLGQGRRGGKLAVLFTGQGSQRLGMGRALAAAFPAFRESFDAVCARFDRELERPLRDVLFAPEGAPEAARLDETAFTQPALFALEVALFRLFESWGVKPDLLLGHSIGEVVAAHVAGVLSLEDACALVAARGRLMQALPRGGAMISLQASEDEVRPLLAGREDRVAIATVNGPFSTVVSGDEASVQDVARHFEAAGRKATRLRTSHAFHSPRMDGMLEDFRRVASRLSFHSPRIPIVSNVSGKRASPDELRSPDYWVRHVRDAVRFADGVRTLEAEGASSFLELGPHAVLAAMALDCLSDEARAHAAFVPALRKDRSEVDALVTAVGSLHVHEHSVDWGAFFEPFATRRVELPTYPFQRERFWVEAPRGGATDFAAAGLSSADHPLLGAAVPLAESEGLLLTGRIALADHPWLAGYALFGNVLLPGSAFLELALAAAHRVGLDRVEDLTVETPLALPAHGAVLLQVSVAPPDETGRRRLALHARPEDALSWTCHATGLLGPAAPSAPFDLRTWPPEGASPLP